MGTQTNKGKQGECLPWKALVHGNSTVGLSVFELALAPFISGFCRNFLFVIALWHGIRNIFPIKRDPTGYSVCRDTFNSGITIVKT